MTDIMEEDPDLSQLGKFLKSIGVNTFDQLLNIPNQDLCEPWEYFEDATIKELASTEKQVIHIFKSFYATICDHSNYLIDPTTITIGEFLDYRMYSHTKDNTYQVSLVYNTVNTLM